MLYYWNVSCPGMTHRIAVIGGDGIGPEVTAEALKVAAASGVDLDITEFDLGGARYLRDGTVLPDEVLGLGFGRRLALGLGFGIDFGMHVGLGR